MKKMNLINGPHPRLKTGMSTQAVNRAPLPRIRREWLAYYHKLLRLREQLLGDRAEQLNELAVPLECGGRDMAKSASDEASQELSLREIVAEQNLLLEIEEALDRLRDGTYGICQLTHLPIEPERLRALPWTTFSEAAAAHLERQYASYGTKSRKAA